jgi:AraC family ethanolamine operon transcriptional activator
MNRHHPTYLLHDVFNDFDEFAEVAQAWDLEFIQLDRGGFNGELHQIGVQGLQVSHARFNRQLYQRGSSPEGMRTFAITEEWSPPPKWRHQEIPPNSIMLFKDRSLDVVSAVGFDVFTISLNDESLDFAMRSGGYEDIEKIYHKADVVTGDSSAIKGVLNYLRQLFDALNQNRVIIDDHRFTQKVKNDIMNNLLNAYETQNGVFCKSKRKLSENKFREVESLIKEKSSEPILIKDLCQIVNTSERTLRRAFWERYGISPLCYVKSLRLNNVRKELYRSNSKTTKVVDIANRWGFWHMGQFAFDYRQLFGELPSETLALK